MTERHSPHDDTEFPIQQVRAETASSFTGIHLNSAGASLQPSVVVNTVVDYLREEAELGGYEIAAKRSAEIEQVYSSLASLIGVDPDEIAITTNATIGWETAFYGFRFSKGDRVVTCTSEYGSNAIAYLHRAQRDGIEIIVVPDTEDGDIDLDVLDLELRHPRTALVSMNHIPTQSGLVLPAERVGALARAHGVPFLLDACQSVGQLEIDARSIGCDVLTATGRKYLRAPRGTGFMYVKRESTALFPPHVLDNRSSTWDSPTTFTVRKDARQYETWERNYALILGLGQAAAYAQQIGPARVESRIRTLGSYLRNALATRTNVRIEDRGKDLCGIVTFTLPQGDLEQLRVALASSGAYCHLSRRTSSQWDLGERNIPEVIRASVHYYNTIEEVDRFVELVGAFCGGSMDSSGQTAAYV